MGRVSAARGARKARPRVGLVLGGGGTLGAAWMAGALTALQERLPVPVGSVDLVVGTSAGSVMAAALRCGISVDEIVAHQRGAALGVLPRLVELDRDSGALPPLPRLRIGSPRLLVTAARAPHRIHPWVAASALLLEGRGQLRSLEALVHALLGPEPVPPVPAPPVSVAAGPALTVTELTGVPAPTGVPAQRWPERETWMIAVDYDSGRRISFGRVGAPPASLPDAVVAACSIPGWYEPKVIDGRRYVDAGVRSTTSLDLLGRAELDEVYVLAPMASFSLDRPFSPHARLERLFRRMITVGLVREIRKVAASGAKVTVLAPGPADLAAIGPNMMDPARRRRVLETSLATSPSAFYRPQAQGRQAA